MKPPDYPLVFAAWLFTTPRWSHLPPLAQAIYPTLIACCDADGITLFNRDRLAVEAGMTMAGFKEGLIELERCCFSFGTLAHRTHIILDDRWISKIRVRIFVPTHSLILHASLFRRESGTPWPSLSLGARAVLPALAAQADGRGWPTLDRVAELSGLENDTAQAAVNELVQVKLAGERRGVGWVASSWPADHVLEF
jgi:hypothetical protein